MSLPGICRPGMCPTWTPGIQGAADRECVQLGHRGSWELPAENVSNLDTRDPGSHRPKMCPSWTPAEPGSRRPRMCPTWTPGILGATGRKCVQVGHQGSWEPPAGNVSNLDTSGAWEPPAGNVSTLDTRGDPGSHRPEESCRPRLNNLSTMVTIKGQHRGVILLPDRVVL